MPSWIRGRKARTGFAEVIYCSNKADAHLLKIFENVYIWKREKYLEQGLPRHSMSW